MCLSSELSSDIAAAILTEKYLTQHELTELREMLVSVQDVFQRLERERRAERSLKVERKAEFIRRSETG
jgi:hypothetical protein